MLMFVVARTIGVGREMVELPYMTSDLTVGTHITLISYAYEYVNYDVTSMTLLTMTGSQSNYVEKVKGIKFGGGGGAGGGLERTLLWDYVTDNNNVIPYGLYTETLHDDIDNYDFIVAEIVSSSGDLSASGWQGTNLWTIDVNALNNAEVQNYLNYTSFGERSSRFYIKDTTFQKTTDNQGNTNGLVRVYGLKWTGGIQDTSDDMSDMTWTLLDSTTSTGTATPIPSGTKYIVVLSKDGNNGKVTMVAKESLSNINKVMDLLQETTYILGGYWKDQAGADYGDTSCQISNGQVIAYSSYITNTTYVYAVS